MPINRLRCQGAELHSTICLSNYALITTVYANTLNICIEHSAQLSSFSLGVLQEDGEEVGGGRGRSIAAVLIERGLRHVGLRGEALFGIKKQCHSVHRQTVCFILRVNNKRSRGATAELGGDFVA